MKKLLLLIILGGTVSFSQETNTPSKTTTTTTTTVSTTSAVEVKKIEYTGKRNEFKGDPTYLIFAGALNLTYERLINEESGFGVNLLISSGKEINTTFALTPYYRFYFGKKPAAGFFFEGFTSINSYQYEKRTINSNYNGFYYEQYYNIERKNTTDLAVGIGLGGKWITNKGIIFELSSGIGRNLLNDYTSASGIDSSYKIVGRGGISVGYRF